jgi:hypothetical protein
VPWTLAGQEVWLRDREGQLEIGRGAECLLRHVLCAGKHAVVTVSAHHAGLPFAAAEERCGGKARITIRLGAPDVEVRPLAAYEALVENAWREHGSLNAVEGMPVMGGVR